MNDLCELVFEDDGETLVALLIGEIDLSNSGAIGDRIRERVANHSLGVVVDLTGLTFLDSSGLELLFDLRQRLESRRQHLDIRVPVESPVRRPLELVDLLPPTLPGIPAPVAALPGDVPA
jgi:anti-anti-sigma factor